MVFFTAAEARKDKWSVMADLIYLKLGGFDATTTLNRSLEPSFDLSGGLNGFTLSDDLGPGGELGLKLDANASKDWYLSYLADIGTGDSDVTWQLFVGANRKFPWGDLMLGYRYLKWELGDDKLVDHLEVNGPIVGAKVWF
jgi:hypothetical protein